MDAETLAVAVFQPKKLVQQLCSDTPKPIQYGEPRKGF